MHLTLRRRGRTRFRCRALGNQSISVYTGFMGQARKNICFRFLPVLAVMLFVVAGCGNSVQTTNDTEDFAVPHNADISSAIAVPEISAVARALPDGFVYVTDAIPDAVLDIRYYGANNFLGTRVDYYLAPVAIMSKEAAQALMRVNDDLKAQGYAIKIFDAYRPQGAVDHFVRWAQDESDTLMKEYFYPDIEKNRLFPEGYIARRSGHSRGSTVDLTLLDMKTGKEVDMGAPFDFFGPISGHGTNLITREQANNRLILRRAMENAGFRPYSKEWWHYTLINEPYPDTYFSFPVK